MNLKSIKDIREQINLLSNLLGTREELNNPVTFFYLQHYIFPLFLDILTLIEANPARTLDNTEGRPIFIHVQAIQKIIDETSQTLMPDERTNFIIKKLEKLIR